MSIIEIEGKKYKLTPVDEGPKMFKFGPNGEGWYLDSTGRARLSVDISYTKEFERFGSCFPTMETALKARDLMRVQNLFISAALVVDPEAGPRNENRACTCCWHTEEKQIYASQYIEGAPAYVHTLQQAVQLRDLLQSIGWPNNLEPMP